MATYVPTNWKTGDIITATKLNNMETGINNANTTANNALPLSGGTMQGDILASESGSVFTGRVRGIYFERFTGERFDANERLKTENLWLTVNDASNSENLPVKSSGYFSVINSSITEDSYFFQLYTLTLSNDTYIRKYNSSSQTFTERSKFSF